MPSARTRSREKSLTTAVPLAQLRAWLAERSRADLVNGMLARSPRTAATVLLHEALESYPLLFLLLAHEYPTRIWLLERGERISSADILTDRMRRRRWNHASIPVDECSGLTDFGPGYLAMVGIWWSSHVLRHEFAHVVSTFFTPTTRERLWRLFALARRRAIFVEPLAAESVGEYTACGIGAYLVPEQQERLRQLDPALYQLLHELFTEAEAISRQVAPAPAFVQH